MCANVAASAAASTRGRTPCACIACWPTPGSPPRTSSRVSVLLRKVDDRPLLARVADERDAPVDQRGEAVLEARKEGEVHHQPRQPADPPAELQPPEARDGRGPRDRGHRPE